MSGNSQVIGWRYYLGVEVACCLGPVDSVSRLLVGDRLAWQGNVTATSAVDIDMPTLFGGDAKEGGVSGIMEVRMGEITQPPDAYMRSVLGVPIPADRGMVTLIFRGRSFGEVTTRSNGPGFAPAGGSGSSVLGSGAPSYTGPSSFYWAAGNPYIKTITPTLTRILAGWNTAVWNAANATIVQTIDYSSAPISAPSDVGVTLRSAGTLSSTILGFSSATEALSFSGIGYCKINDEWMKVLSINDGLEGGDPGFYNTMEVIRGYFGSAAVPHVDGTPIFCWGAPTQPIVAMNPAHMLYQCVTDPVWGMGKDTTLIDEASFSDAGATLLTEGFGLCMIWYEQSSMEDFIVEVLKHIDGILDWNLSTGLYELRLVRNNYDPSELPVFDESNIVSFDSFSRSGWGETTNELVVNFTSQATGGVASISVQDLGNILIQGSVVSQTHTYNGVQDPSLAFRLAVRDLTAMSTPLAVIAFKANRQAAFVKKGAPIKINWAAEALTGLICRVADIDYGTLEDGTVSITAIEDVFATPTSSYGFGSAQETLWVNPGGPPSLITLARTIEIPYQLLQVGIDTSVLTGEESYPYVLAQKPAVQNSQMCVYSASDIGFTHPLFLGTSDYNSTATTSAAISFGDTTLPYTNVKGDSPEVYTGGLALLDDEWISITSVDTGAGTMVVVRGVLDSIPAEHISGTVVWMIANGANFHGFLGEATLAKTMNGMVEYYRETGKSISSETSIGSGAAQTHTHTSSWFNPYPPSNVKFDGVYFPAGIHPDFTVTWGGRNRLQQVIGLVGWTEASLAPEAGVTYTLDVYDATTHTLIHSETGLTAVVGAGGSYHYTTSPGATNTYEIHFYAVRGTLKSNPLIVTASFGGYGYAYGGAYGESF